MLLSIKKSGGAKLRSGIVTSGLRSAGISDLSEKPAVKWFRLFASCVLLFSALLMASFASAQSAERDEMIFFLPDALGSAIAAVNEEGDLCWRETYTPYGDKTINDDAVADLGMPAGCGVLGEERGYAGHTEDYESDLVYMQQRYYDPSVGRFLSVDPRGVDPEDTRSHNRYAYAANNPYKYIDPDGAWLEDVGIGIPSLGIGLHSLVSNLLDGNWGAAALDASGIVADGAAILTPGVPGVAGMTIKAGRVAKRTGLESRGYRPAPGERTIQGQVDAATQAGNPTIQRGGQDLFRLRSSGHGQAGGTATPQNVYRTNPRTGERFGPQSGPDRAVTIRDIRELYKAQTNHGTSSIRTRSGC